MTENNQNIVYDSDDGDEKRDPGSNPDDFSDNSFNDFIEGLALKQKAASTTDTSGIHKELSQFSTADYAAIEPSTRTENKINELLSIVSSIERKAAIQSPVMLEKTYKIDYRKELNDRQLEAVTSISGPVLVIAGAGSGKTRVIIHRVAYLIENGVNPEEILLLTFTRKAASEMLGRVQKLLNDAGAARVFGGTFHAFSNYILRKYSGLLNIPPNFTIIDEEDAADTIDLIRSEMKLDKLPKAFPRKNRIQEIISSARNRNMTISEIIEEDFTGLREFTGTIEKIGEGFRKYKKLCNIFDYDDLMDFLRDSLRSNGIFRKRLQKSYRYIMVDEYQDTNVVQKEIVELLTDDEKNIMVVGDDSQSIYSFRGANYENILRFPETYPDCRVIKIEENYRSNQKILDFTNEIILNARIGYKKRLFSSITNDNMPLIRKFYDQEHEAEFVVDRILEYREQGISLNQVAVLVRSFWHARYIEVELNKRNIPYVAVGGLKFNERKHVKDVISYLRIILNPYDAVAWHRVLKYLPGVGLVTARKLIGKIISDEINADEYRGSKFHESLGRLLRMVDNARSEEITVAGKIEIIREYYAPVLREREYDYQVRLLDINVLIELAARYKSLESFLAEFALDPPSKNFGTKTTPLVDEGEDKPLTVSTIHSAKGLEWYSVIIPHALDGLIPSVKSLNSIEELEEERRLFYVACSRAKQELLITMPSYVSIYNAFLSYPSRFIIEISKERFNYR